MKSKLKFVFKLLVSINLILLLVLVFGVLLPKENYRNKDEQFQNLIISNCNIVDIEKGEILQNRHVLIQNGRIAAIDSISSNYPKGIYVIDAKGNFLMPGLWDMHMHTLSLSPQLHFPLLIAHGVTGVRDMGDGDSWVSNIEDNSPRDNSIWKVQESTQHLLTPKIIQSTSFHVEELEDVNKENVKKKTSELITRLKQRGEPFVKVQLESSNIPDFAFYELQKEAKRQEIPILGHLSADLDIYEVIENGFVSIEHAWALIPHFVPSKNLQGSDIEKKIYDLKNQDDIIALDILKNMAENDIYYCPTHVTSNRKEYLSFDPDFNQSPHNIYVENVQLFLWKLVNWLHIKGYDRNTDLPVLKSYYERGLEVSNLANKQGVKLLAGSDALDRNVYYGLSLHLELQELVKAGLSPSEALKTATVNPAKYHGVLEDYGTIEPGKIADFVFLSRNPLEDIANTQKINAVFFNNRLYDEMELKDMKSFVSDQAKSFGISCKFVWNMIKGMFG